jgi:hypothetical protein
MSHDHTAMALIPAPHGHTHHTHARNANFTHVNRPIPSTLARPYTLALARLLSRLVSRSGVHARTQTLPPPHHVHPPTHRPAGTSPCSRWRRHTLHMPKCTCPRTHMFAKPPPPLPFAISSGRDEAVEPVGEGKRACSRTHTLARTRTHARARAHTHTHIHWHHPPPPAGTRTWSRWATSPTPSRTRRAPTRPRCARGDCTLRPPSLLPSLPLPPTLQHTLSTIRKVCTWRLHAATLARVVLQLRLVVRQWSV